MTIRSFRHSASLPALLAATAVLGASIVQAQPPQVPPEQRPPTQQQTTPPTDPQVPRQNDRDNTDRDPADRLDPARKPATGANSSSGQDNRGGQPAQNPADTTFVNEALASGRTEIAAARLAQERASNDDVKAFARELERDHLQLNSKLEALQRSGPSQASGAGQASSPGQGGSLAPQQGGSSGAAASSAAAGASGAATAHGNMSSGLHDLARKTGAEFDREFLNLQIRHHQESIRKFEAAANRTAAMPAASGGSSVASVAREALPELRRHAERAEELSQQVGDAR